MTEVKLTGVVKFGELEIEELTFNSVDPSGRENVEGWTIVYIPFYYVYTLIQRRANSCLTSDPRK